jgi:outer membrane protein
MKKLLVTLLVVLSASAGIAQQKIGHVNSQKLLDTLPSRKTAIEQLRQFEISGTKELEEMEMDFEKGYAKYQKELPTMSPVIQKIEEEKLMRKQQSIQDREQSLNREMQAVSQDLNTPILDRVQRAVKLVADRKKLSYVIDETVTLYFAGGIDITAEVLADLLRMDKEETLK